MIKKCKKPEYRNIKTSIKAVANSTEVINKINNIVKDANGIKSDTYKFIKSFIIHKFNNGKKLPLIDKKFIELIMNKVLSKQQKNFKVKNDNLLTELKDFYTNNFQPICNHKLNNGVLMSVIIHYMATNVLTTIENNLKEHFIKRLKKFLRQMGETFLIDRVYTKVQKRVILNKLIKNILNYEYNQIDPIFRDWFNTRILGIVIPRKFQKHLAYDCKVEPQKYLLFTMNICKAYEDYNEIIDNQIKQIQNDPYYERILELKKQDYKLVRKELKSLKLKSETFKLQSKKKSLFSVFPKSNYGLGHIMFDTSSLVKFFITENKTEITNNITFYKEEIWDTVFDMDNKIFKISDNKYYEFNYMLSTDGIACSLMFKRRGKLRRFAKKKEKEEIDELNQNEIIDNPRKEIIKEETVEFNRFADLTKSEVLKYNNVVFIDPGVKYLIYAMDKHGKLMKYSANQRRNDIGTIQHNKILEEYKEKHSFIKRGEIKLSKVNSNTLNCTKYNEYLKVEDTCRILKGFYKKPIWRKLRWRRFINKQRAEAQLLNKIEQTYGKNILLVLGDWSRREGMSFGAPTLGIELRNLLATRFDVVLLDEFRTSKLCNGCHGQTEDVKINGKLIHRLLGCRKCNVFSEEDRKLAPQAEKNPRMKYVQRDTNSCKNMLTIFNYALEHGMGQRPEPFRR